MAISTTTRSQWPLTRTLKRNLPRSLVLAPGPWTVNGFLLIALDRPDAFPAGDLALRRAVKRLYGLDHLPSEAELRRMAERWRPYRSLAAACLFDSEFG